MSENIIPARLAKSELAPIDTDTQPPVDIIPLREHPPSSVGLLPSEGLPSALCPSNPRKSSTSSGGWPSHSPRRVSSGMSEQMVSPKSVGGHDSELLAKYIGIMREQQENFEKERQDLQDTLAKERESFARARETWEKEREVLLEWIDDLRHTAYSYAYPSVSATPTQQTPRRPTPPHPLGNGQPKVLTQKESVSIPERVALLRDSVGDQFAIQHHGPPQFSLPAVPKNDPGTPKRKPEEKKTSPPSSETTAEPASRDGLTSRPKILLPTKKADACALDPALSPGALQAEEGPRSPMPSLSPPPEKNRRYAGHTPHIASDIELESSAQETDEDPALKGPLSLPSVPKKSPDSGMLHALNKRLEEVSQDPEKATPAVMQSQGPSRATTPAGSANALGGKENEPTLVQAIQEHLDGVRLKEGRPMNFDAPLGSLTNTRSGSHSQS